MAGSLDLSALAQALEASGLGVAMRGVAGLYPAVDVIHLAGLVLLVGPIGLLDLRILGVARAIPLAPLSRLATPLAMAGVGLLLGSGALLFAPDATPLVRSPMFGAKMALMLLALGNAVAFRRLFHRLEQGGGGEPPPLARVMAAASIGLWLAVGCLGRLIGFV